LTEGCTRWRRLGVDNAEPRVYLDSMFGSQTLETAIGLALMFFLIATLASIIVELISTQLKKRSRDLETGLKAMLGPKDSGVAAEDPLENALDMLKRTSVYAAASTSAGRQLVGRDRSRGPSYLSAKSFADAVVEMLSDQSGSTLLPLDSLPANLRKRLKPLVREADGDLVKLKSGLEQWFDDTMQRLQGSYKRWATAVLFVVGLLIAVGANASTIDVAQRLWESPVTRQAVADSAGRVATSPGNLTTQLQDLSTATTGVQELQLPIGWDKQMRGDWSPATVIGWLVTALLVLLGAPFWFDLLNRLVSVRAAGTKPPPAAEDPSSATGNLVSARGSRAGAGAVRQPAAATIAAPSRSPVDLAQSLADMLGLAPPDEAAT
jgi:hypothetical protein